jgi:hypothetical protein
MASSYMEFEAAEVSLRDAHDGSGPPRKIVFLIRKDYLCFMPDDLPLEQALTALGSLLAADAETVRLVAVGGAALRLREYVERATMDVDIIGRVLETGAAWVNTQDESPVFAEMVDQVITHALSPHA